VFGCLYVCVCVGGCVCVSVCVCVTVCMCVCVCVTVDHSRRCYRPFCTVICLYFSLTLFPDFHIYLYINGPIIRRSMYVRRWNGVLLMARPHTSDHGLSSRSVGGLSMVSPTARLSSSNALLARPPTDRELSSRSVGRLLTVLPNAHLSYSNALLVRPWTDRQQTVSLAHGLSAVLPTAHLHNIISLTRPSLIIGLAPFCRLVEVPFYFHKWTRSRPTC